MNTQSNSTLNVERPVQVLNGWLVLIIHFLVVGVTVYIGLSSLNPLRLFLLIFPLITGIMSFIAIFGYVVLQPNEACLLLLFGKYKGTVRSSGFNWTNPFYTKSKVSLRTRNFNVEKLKVNDKSGNPIEIGAVVTWRVFDTAKAAFDVVDYISYINLQSETAVRQLASAYSYDHGEENEITLRGGSEEVSHGLLSLLQERLVAAGVEVLEARITHLAYAPEIAQAMLRRQQAEAVIAARQKIVQGAVSMVDLALRELAEKNTVILDDERKAAMVSNLLVVLCGESEATPVVNTGTLYN